MLLHLKNHCIETAARQERRRLVSALLELDESTERFTKLADDLALVTAFLEQSDFRRLRSDRPELSGGHDVAVELTRNAGAEDFRLDLSKTPAFRVYNANGKIETPKVAPGDGWSNEIDYFLRCVQTGRRPTIITPDDALNAVRIVEAEMKSIRTGKVVKL